LDENGLNETARLGKISEGIPEPENYSRVSTIIGIPEIGYWCYSSIFKNTYSIMY
jgi:hypothetical protein